MLNKKMIALFTASLLFSAPSVLASESESNVNTELTTLDIMPYEGELTDEVMEEPQHFDDGGLNELFNDWEMNGYPENVGYVIFDSDINKMVVGLLNNTPEEQNAILSQLSHGDGFVFEQATFSYNEMMAVLDELATLPETSDDVYGIGLGWAVINEQLTGFGPSGNELRVTLDVAEESYDYYVTEMANRYGEKVHVSIGLPITTLDLMTTSLEMSAPVENVSTNYLPMIALFIAVAAVSVFVFFKRGQALKQTTAGTIVGDYTEKDVKEAIKEAQIEPKEDVYRSIQDKVK